MGRRTQRSTDEITAEALQLDPLGRAAVARSLLDSLDDLTDEDYERLWAQEAERRLEDFDSGVTTAIDGDEVFARAEARVR